MNATLAFAAKENGGRSYDFVLVTKDDDHWLGPLDLDSFVRDPPHSKRMYTKNCKVFWGINDKTLLLGARSAERMLGRLYSDFWAPRGPTLVTQSTEEYL